VLELCLGSGNELTLLTKPGQPTSLAVTAKTKDSISLSWTKGEGAQKTLIRRKTESYPSSKEDGAQVYFNTESTATDSNLNPNTLYYYRAWAYNSDSGYYSDSYGETTGRALANIPSSLSTIADSQTQITTFWSANSNPSGTKYYCENTTAGTNSGWITDTSWSSANLSAGTEYAFRVKARNGDEVSTSFTDEAT